MAGITKQFIWQNKASINFLVKQIELIQKYVVAKRDKTNEVTKYERELALNAPKANQIFITAGIMPTIHWGSQFNGYQERSVSQDIPYFTRLWLGEDNLFGGRSSSHDLNIIDDIINRYVSLIGLYTDQTRRSWINTFNPLTYIGFILSLPAKTIRFLLESLFDTNIPKNFITQGISGFINVTTWWLTVVLPFVEKHGGLVQVWDLFIGLFR